MTSKAPPMEFSARRFLAPLFLRALVRRDEIWLVVLSIAIGALAGLCVWIISVTTRLAHKILFNIPGEGRLSGVEWLSVWRVLLVPILGGLVYGLFTNYIGKRRANQPVDPIEANALHGGRMSVRDSLVVAFQTFLSNGCGASLGLEAGFTQLAGAFGSRIGAAFRVRREDLRILVGCGAGGAIGAAFDAPMAGSFYAFELILGSYSLANIAPVVVATLSAIGMTHLMGYNPHLIVLPAFKPFEWEDVPPVALLAVSCALLGIGIMKGVATAEQFFKTHIATPWMRPVLGGAVVGCLALYTPTVLSGGHAAMGLVYDGRFPLTQAAIFLVLKIVASCVSIGAGFRGGLFFASLYLGVLSGDVFGALLRDVGISHLPPNFAISVGMAAMATSIIGSPMAMVCLALEMTGDFELTMGVLLANILSMLTVRRLFGYSFATWRFHLRGETIRSALDVSWMRRLSVSRMMRSADAVAPADAELCLVRAQVPLGSARGVVILGPAQRYLGIVTIGELYRDDHAPDQSIGSLAILKNHWLTPEMNIEEAVHAFTEAEADALAVVDNPVDRRVVGVVTEKFVLRRYAEELDRSRRDLAGEGRARYNDSQP